MTWLIVSAILIFVYLVMGWWISDQCYDFENPIFKPLFVLFWPIVLIGVVMWLCFGSWIKETIEYYKNKKECEYEQRTKKTPE